MENSHRGFARRGTVLALSAVLVTFLCSGPAWGQPSLEHGAPKGRRAAPRPAPKPGKGPARTAVTFSGFQAHADGSCRLYVQLTAETAVEANVSGKKAEYVLHGVAIPVPNNRNPLLLRYFSTVVVSARITGGGAPKKKKGRSATGETSDVHVVVEMREAVKPEHRMLRHADGTATLVVDFPKPQKPIPPEAAPVPPPAKVESEDAAR